MTDKANHPGTGALLTKRRQFMAAIAMGGVAATSGAGLADSADPPVDVGLGGGPMADELSHRQARSYWWDEPELPDAGVKGRYLHLQVDAGGFNEGDLLFDDGEEWALFDAGYRSITTEKATNRYEYRVFQRGGEIIAINDRGAVVETGNFATDATAGDSDLGQVLQAVIDDHGRPTSIFLAPPESGNYWYLEQGIESSKAIEIHGTTPMISDGGTPTGHGTTIVPDEAFSEDMITIRGGDFEGLALSSKIVNIGIYGAPTGWKNRSGRMIVFKDKLRDFYIRDCIFHTCPDSIVELVDCRGRFFSHRTMYEQSDTAGLKISGEPAQQLALTDNYFWANQVGIHADIDFNELRFTIGGGWFDSIKGPAIKSDGDGDYIGLTVTGVTFNGCAFETQDATILNTANGTARGHLFIGCFFRGDIDNPPDCHIDYSESTTTDSISVIGGMYSTVAERGAKLTANSQEIMTEYRVPVGGN